MCSEPIVVGYDPPPEYTVKEGDRTLNLTIKVFSHPISGAPRPFTLSFDLEDGTASMCPASLYTILFAFFHVQVLMLTT